MIRHPILLLVVLVLPGAARAQSLDRPAGGAACLAMAGACVAGAPDPAALWLNPALLPGAVSRLTLGLGVGQQERSVFRLRPVDPWPEARDAHGARPLGHLAVAQPLPWWGERITVALGYRVGLNSGSRYAATHDPPGTPSRKLPRNDPGRYLGTEADLQEHLIYVGLAVRWRFLQLGAALELGHLRLTHQRALWIGEAVDAPRLEEPALDMLATLELTTPSVAPGAVAGVLVTPLQYLAIGVSVRPPVTHHLRGEVSLAAPTGAPAGAKAVSATDGGATLDLRLPLELRGGISAGWPLLRLNVDLLWARWSAADDPGAELDGASIRLASASGGATRHVPLESLPLGVGLRDAISVRAGLASVLPGGFLTLRGGYAYHRGATDPEQPSAVVLDLQRHVMALGVELAVKPLRLALGVSQQFGVPMETGAVEATLHNPLAPAITANVGQGRYTSTATRAVIEVQAGW